MMMGCLAAVCVTLSSCNDDDDEKALTPTEVQTAFNAVKGNHDGQLIYAAPNPKNLRDVTDTVNISWNIATDSTLIIRQFPVALLGNSVSDSTARKAIQTSKPQDILCNIEFVRLSPVSFYISPASVTLNLNYGGKDHKVQIPFYGNRSTYSYGQQIAKDKSLFMQILEGPVYEDGKQTTWIKQAVPFVFIAKK